jgi:DHA1 family multidrug resistance protein-like MFS transporter
MNRRVWAWTSVLFCNEFLRSALYYVWVPLVLSHRFHMPIWWIGFCTSCQFMADAVTKFFYGIAASRGYSRWMVSLGTAVSGVSVVVLLFTHDPLSLLIFSVLFGCGAASVWPAALSHYARHTEKGKAESLAKAFVPWMSGTGVGMFLPNVLLHFRHSMYFVLTIMAAITFLCTLVIRPTGGSGAPSLKRELILLRVLSRKLRPFLLPMLLQTMVIGTITPFLALFGVRSLHLYPREYALLLLAIGALTILLMIPLGNLSDRMGQLPMLTIAFFVSALSIALLAFSRSWQQALIPAAIFGAGFGAVFPTWNALFIDAVPHWLHSRAIGLFTAIEDSGTVLGPLIGALSWQYIGYSGPFLMAGLVMLFLSAYFFVWWKQWAAAS